MAAVAGGSATSGGIANSRGRPVTSLAHPLSMLERVHVLAREEDLLAQRRPRSRIADPLLRFEAAMIRPDVARFERDVVAADRDPRHLRAIGEAKGGEARRGIGHLRRLERLP